MDTTSAFLHSCRTLTRFGSIANVCATLRNCCFAISYGFSLRCETGASTVVTEPTPFCLQSGWFSTRAGRSLLDSEVDHTHRRFPSDGRICDEAQRVIAGRQDRAGRIAAGHADRIAAGKHVAHPREQTDAPARWAPELQIDERERSHVLTDVGTRDCACDERQQRRLDIGRSK